MKLKRVKIAGFRGFNDEQAVELGADLIIISGNNHTGKTSLAEALSGYSVDTQSDAAEAKINTAG